MKNMIIASTSTVYGSGYLDYMLDELQNFFSGVEKIIFIPFARPGGISHEDYTEKVEEAFSKIGISVKGIHEFEDQIGAINTAEGIFTGGGNTFVLLNQLYKLDLIAPLQKVIKKGTRYLGTSAGSNICGLTINTTNDMPIVYPPSFKSLALVPFNINPHYLDPNPESEHMGETRETRLKEFHQYNSQPVIGLREGSWLSIKDGDIILKGNLSARIFEYGKDPYEIEANTSLKSLN